MARRRWLGVVAASLVLAGCATTPDPVPSRSEFEDMRDVLASNPSERAAVEAECQTEMKRRPDDEQAMMGAMLDLDTAEVPQAFCGRLFAAIVRGDVSYADFVAFQQGDTDPAMLRRFLRAMRLDPSATRT
jgi:hypothetical protein